MMNYLVERLENMHAPSPSDSATLGEAIRTIERMTWNTDMGAAPYEKKVLTLWEGDTKKNPVILVNIKCDGNSLGSPDSWWHSTRDQWPTKWMHLPES